MSEIGGMAVAAIIVGLVLLRALRATRPHEVDAWARQREVELDEEGRAVAAAYLRRSRRWRLLAFVVPFVLVVAGLTVFNAVTQGQEPPWWVRVLRMDLAIGCYFAGTVLAEVTWRRTRGGAVRSAALSPRRLADYVPRWARRLQWGTAALAVGLLPVVVLSPVGDSLWNAGRAAAGVVAVAVVVEGALRWIVRLPQPFSTAREIALDDAIRATSMLMVLGVGVAFELLTFGQVANALISSDPSEMPSVPGPVAAVVWLGPLLAAFVTWMWLTGPNHWRVRREVGSPGDAAHRA
jgi:hypothetical protein